MTRHAQQRARKPRTMPRAFDEWMRRYKRNPAAFEHTLECVRAHDRKVKGGGTEYGREAAALLRALMRGE